MSSSNGDHEDVDARFSELIRQQFGDRHVPRRLHGDGAADPAPAPAPFSFDEAMERAEVEDDPYVPEALPRMRPWTGRVVTGAVMLTLSLVTAVLAMFGVPIAHEVQIVAAACGVAGLGVLLWSVPRQRRDPSDDGARL